MIRPSRSAADPARYVDAEDCNEHIRLQVEALAGLDYDHDGHGALPVRPEVVEYVLHRLCRPRTGWIRAAGVELPVVRLRADGTLVLAWIHAGRRLVIEVPTRNVLLCQRRTGETAITIKLGARPDSDADELRDLFAWLADGDE